MTLVLISKVLKLISLFLLVLHSLDLTAQDRKSPSNIRHEKNQLTVLTFNTMCSFCHKTSEDKFEKRKESIKRIIEDANADIISLQEVTLESHVHYFLNKETYTLFYYKNSLLSYPDVVLAVKKNRFRVLNKKHYWLGDKEGDFSFGWDWALPRILLEMKLIDLYTHRKITLLGAHFDNLRANLLGAGIFVKKMAQTKSNILFLGDTNSTLDMRSYKELTTHLKDMAINFKGGKEFCYYRKGEVFPDCRVDHILSNHEYLKPLRYEVILKKSQNTNRFPSDHRPIKLIFETGEQ